MGDGFGRRILAKRTRTLAVRGVATETALLPPQLVCVAGGRFVALPMPLVASIRPFGCQPVPLLRPRAGPIVLGLALFGHRLVSVLDLARLLGGDDGDTGADGQVGRMILLRATALPVALWVEQVLGVMRLQPSAEPGRALLPANDAADALPGLVTLLAADSLAAAIASLDDA